MRDVKLGDTIYFTFTTRAFATGIPTVLAGTPVVSAYEDDSLTQITAGITLGVDHDSVVGLNLLTLVLTGANGYETLKDYNFVITTGTVDSVSVVGESVLSISIDSSAAAQDLANGTDGLGAIKGDTAAILTDTGTTLEARFTGMTSLTEWLSAMAGKQASDATAQTEMRAAGAGSGSYLATTDSLEATQDEIGAFNDLSAAEVASEIADSWNVDTIPELGVAVPDATPVREDALMLLYMELRNKTTQTAILKKIFNDAATAIIDQTVADDGTTTTKSEMVGGT